MTRVLYTAVLATALAAATGCVRDPAKDAPKADVSTPAGDAKPDDHATSGEVPAGAEMLSIDASASKLNWTGSKVTKSHPGGFKTFSGAITLVENDAAKSKVEIEIDVASLWTDSEKLAGHLKSEDFFDVANHPKATFTSTAITAGGAEGATHTVKGNLTLRGVTKEISFPATIAVGEKDVTAKAKFSINRQDFGIKYPGAPDDLIRDEVLIDWTIVAKRAADA